MTNDINTMILLGPCTSIAPAVKDLEGNDVKCIRSNLHKSSHISGIVTLPDQEPQAYTWDDQVGLARTDDKRLKIACTCGWEYGPVDRIYDMGMEGAAHSANTGHILRKPE